MIWKPHVTVAAVVERDGRFLIVKEEVAGRVVYNQPAGHLDEGESLATAVAREVLEETAWHFTPDGVLGVYRWMNPKDKITYLRVCFRGTCEAHEPRRVLDRGILRACWMTRAEIEDLKPQLRSPLVLRCVDDYLAGKRYPLALLTDVA
jgi:ADP-ribose pyrophosphatase YjhB (NUDIX family)